MNTPFFLRALKSKGNTPKYGIIFNTSFIGKAKGKNKGRISRYLANKASIACRIDAFGGMFTAPFARHTHDPYFIDSSSPFEAPFE